MFTPTASARSRRALLAVGCAGAILTLALTINVPTATARNDSRPSQPATTYSRAQAESPVRLKIPKIRVDAAVEHVGLTPEGAMNAPKGPATTAWYQPGPRPGETGSAVIDGHFGWENGTPAVFDNLHTLQAGDKLYIKNAQGSTTAFVVRGFKTYAPNEEASSVFQSNDGKAHLNLITCTGTWNRAQQSYSSRLVVFADKETYFESTDLGVITAN